MRYVIPPASSGSVLGSPPSWSCLECTQEASYQTPNHLIWLHPTWRSSSSIPRSVWMFPHPFWGHPIGWKIDGALSWKWAPPLKPDLSGEVTRVGLVAGPCSMGLGQKKHRHTAWQNNMELRPCEPTIRSEGQQDMVQFVPSGRRRWGPGHPDTWHRILVPSDRYTCLF